MVVVTGLRTLSSSSAAARKKRTSLSSVAKLVQRGADDLALGLLLGARVRPTYASHYMADSSAARPREETLDVLYDVSQLLQTGLDRETLSVLVGLTESGVNPEALAAVVKELRRESAALTAEASMPAQISSRASIEAAAMGRDS